MNTLYQVISWRPSPPLARAFGLAGLALIAIVSVARALGWILPNAMDLHAYWVAGTSQPYAVSHEGLADAYLYSPAFTQLFELLRVLPYGLVLGLWTAISLLLLRWMAPNVWPLLLIIFVPEIMTEVIVGNVHMLLAGMVILGFRYPGVWAFALLTKVTPGIGLLWFLVRREWRSFAIALGATVAIAAVSFLIAPPLWADWIRALIANVQSPAAVAPFMPVPVWVRLPIAALVIVWGARRDRRWTMPIAVVLASPTLWLISFVVLVAILPLRRYRATAPASWPAEHKPRFVPRIAFA